MLRTAILAVMLGLAVAQDVHRGRPFQNPNQAYHQQQQAASRNVDNGQYQEQRQYQPEPSGQSFSERKTTTTPIPIIQWNKQQEHDGTYHTNYETGNNIIAEESGYIKTVGQGEEQAEALVQQGSYSYTSPEGQLITIHYTADETGFHASGDHIPTPPPVSEEIQKGLDLIYAGIRQQQEAAAREAQQKGNQPLNQQVVRRDDHTGQYRP
ncbi:endocuticle structural glycoprotein SgAbd-8-like isoform X3 [Phymastichus coffea]|uniref:endocuticle structural glycoprotein SgAbd-8-like isoform X3 n=1 Tax=Phymastichus coffea TaxID=108790 RepID=UPI00273CE1A6|nr:endocuticle structural glycoprotein SgAbd-8-like isoform X3 [Phymastichus coffea]